MDADAENTDGNNYMYLTEDANYVYIGLDLCSDTTDNGADEWVGVWLITNQAQFFNESYQRPTEWYAALNNGAESLVHDVEKDQTMPFIDEEGESSLYYLFPGYWFGVNGTVDGDSDEIVYNDDVYLNVTSEYNGTHYITRLDYHIDFYDYFNVFNDTFVDHVYRVALDISSLHNVTVDEHFLSVSDFEGNLNPLVKQDLGTGTSETTHYLDIDSEYFTTENETILSMNTVSDAPFNSSYDYTSIRFYYNYTTNIGEHSAYPHSSIQSYDIEWSFGPSENNATNHRQFEIKIPKSELEGYEMDTDLGIIVGGYGTLTSFPNTHNWVYANDTNMYLPEESSIYYNYYSMPLKGQIITTETTTSTLTNSTTTTTTPGGIDPALYLIIGGAGAAVVIIVILFLVVRKK
ncbi:MAG: hypothetical protein E4H14_19695 [Candidatus Thorarchaeota archaeon]|nr:MAG: hypothetical protein E4H14_19695 [Candidatus Thorarchaeota archaeon]